MTGDRPSRGPTHPFACLLVVAPGQPITVPSTRWLIACAAVGAMLLTAAVIGWHVTRFHPVSRGTVPPLHLPSAAESSGTPGLLPNAISRREAAAFAPSRMRVADLHLDAAMRPVGTSNSGAIAVPDDPSTLGFWVDGAKVGSTRGTAVVVGHVDSAVHGIGALFDLSRLRPGERIVVTRGRRHVAYNVAAVREFDKARLPTEQLFSRTTSPRLVVIT